jgi:N-acetylglucosaminyldiphosphoundecaprenol N-acetyl-beta-D-mannosaminyltransferase
MKLKFLQYEVSTILPSTLGTSKLLINTINPHSYCVAKKDSEFQKSLIFADVLIPDGIGIVLGFKFLYGLGIKRIAGYELHLHYLNMMNEKGGKVFYLGSSEKTLSFIRSRTDKQFPNIQVETYSPPYKDEFSEEESQLMVSKINSFKPDVLFIGMTAPKQEKWAYKFKEQIDTKVICSIGAVFDFFAGTVKRPSKIWISLGLEWLPRLLCEPRRLWKRTLISSTSFIIDMILIKFSFKDPN